MQTKVLTSVKALSALVLLFLCSAFMVQTEWVDANLAEASKELVSINTRITETKSYSFEVNYKTYKSHSSGDIYEQQSGTVIKNGLYYKSEIMGKTITQDKTYRVTIDTVTHMMKVNYAFEGSDPNLNFDDYLKVLGLCRQVKIAKQNGMTGFRFEMKNTRGTVAQEVFFDNAFVKRVTYYYADVHEVRKNNEINEQMVYPKLVIDFSNFRSSVKFDKELFNTKKYFKIKQDKLVPVGPYKNYKVIDGRFKN